MARSGESGGGKVRRWIREPVVRYAALSLAALLVAVAGWRLVRHPFAGVIRLDDAAFTTRTRSSLPADVVGGAQILYERGRSEEAVLLLERYIRSRPEGTLASYAEYSAGYLCLVRARHVTAGVFIFYEREWVERGMAHLSRVAGGSSPSSLRQESLLLMAQGALMLRQGDRARAFLEQSLEGGGDPGRRGSALLRELESGGN